MSVKTTDSEAFKFLNERGNLEQVPAGAFVYVHVTDNGQGFHKIHGKILSEDKAMEYGWQRILDEQGQTAKIPSDTANLLLVANELVLAKMIAINPNIQFYNSLVK